MNNEVQTELARVHAPEVTSDFEKEVLSHIHCWASVVYGEDSISIPFKELAEEFWNDKLENSGVRKIIR